MQIVRGEEPCDLHGGAGLHCIYTNEMVENLLEDQGKSQCKGLGWLKFDHS